MRSLIIVFTAYALICLGCILMTLISSCAYPHYPATAMVEKNGEKTQQELVVWSYFDFENSVYFETKYSKTFDPFYMRSLKVDEGLRPKTVLLEDCFWETEDILNGKAYKVRCDKR